MPLPKNVSDAAAGKNLQAASAHPHAERELWGEPDTVTSMTASNLHRPNNREFTRAVFHAADGVKL